MDIYIFTFVLNECGLNISSGLTDRIPTFACVALGISLGMYNPSKNSRHFENKIRRVVRILFVVAYYHFSWLASRYKIFLWKCVSMARRLRSVTV